ncbi:MAG: NirA family protein [Opitutales bacterium]|nr:NirA family protein [Opitutales bacterium]
MSTFTTEQQEYLKGFFAGVAQRPGNPFVGQTASGAFTDDPSAAAGGNLAAPTVHGTPIEDLCKEEQIKHKQHGLDIWDKLLDNAARDKFPEGGDVFRYKFHGLFYVTPAQESLMLRCRIPGCVLRADQLEAIADIAADWGGGYSHVTTRGNLQVREIMPRDSVDVLLKLRDAGLTSQGSGADNLRNITASPTSGFDPDEVLDVLPYARAMHHYILNNREMYDLPRKFNIAFDNGGAVSVCADTNDIAFYAVRVKEDPQSPISQSPISHLQSPISHLRSIGFRVQLCGITGHKQFAKDCGLLVRPEQAVALAAAMIRVFRENGDRTNRKKARLKYLVDNWGVEKFLAETQKHLAFDLDYVPLDACEPRKAVVKHGYIGPHPQKDADYRYLGVTVPVGRLEVDQMRGLADIARRFGKAELRLTVWQNVILPHIRATAVDACIEALRALGLDATPSHITNGLVACTGNRGCKYAATDTKGQALKLGAYLKERVPLDEAINIHFTGCPHSCAQHYIGDIGLLGCKVKVGDEKVEGYNIVFGGGVDNDQGIAREVFSAVPFDEVPPLLERFLRVYLEARRPGERFVEFTRRHTVDDLRALAEAVSVS